MDIIDMARDLGNAIKESNEMVRLKSSEAKMMQDEKARTILDDMYAFQEEMTNALHKGEEREVLESIKQKYIEKQNEMQNYDITRDYLEDKSRVESLMKKINDVILYSMTGEESCSGHDCSSCGCGCGE